MARFIILLLVCLVPACGWFGVSEKQKNLETATSTPVIVPEELDQPVFTDAMPIPEITDFRGLAGQELEIGLPPALSTTFGVEQIVIRRLGDDRWVFLDLPTATVWPRVLLFWEENRLPLAQVEPRDGVLETEWITGAVGNPDEIYESLQAGGDLTTQADAKQYKFRVRVEPGVRNGSTELHMDQKERPLEGDDGPIDWDAGSDNPELEGKLLTVLAYYLGDQTAEGPSVSLLAAGLQESKATLEADAEGMVLKYKLDFDRAWATVGEALKDAGIDVADLDRTSANYYVNYTFAHDPDSGFFARFFTRDKSGEENAAKNRFRVHLQPDGEKVLVTVGRDNEVAVNDTDSAILRERLLKLIKEYST